MCDNSTYDVDTTEKCHSVEEIAEYLKLITVETWSSYGSLNFNLHEKAPIVRNDHLIKMDSLEYKRTQSNTYHLNKHLVQTEDSWLSLG
jgi:hypothetical protein